MNTVHPTGQEQEQFSITAYKGIEVGLGKADPLAVLSAKLELEYPGHLILIQAGEFMHGFDRTAYTLHTLKKYKLQLIGTTSTPHLRIGFPVGLEKKAARNKVQRRLWSFVDEFQIPYVALIGNQAAGYETFGSNRLRDNEEMLSEVTDDVVQRVITDLKQIGAVNTAATKQLLANPNTSGFRLKEQATDLDTQLLHDIIKMPRNLRSTYGENLRVCSARIVRGVFAYGTSPNQSAVLHDISTDVDMLKYHLTQAPRLNNLKFAIEHRVGLAVELGRLVGGLSRAKGMQS